MDNSDFIFLNKTLSYFDIKRDKVKVFLDPSLAEYPDIWIELKQNDSFDLYITNEWKSQNQTERHKRLVHEVLHMAGHDHWNHPIDMGGFQMMYSTYPDEDSFSWFVYFSVLHDIPMHKSDSFKNWYLFIFVLLMFLIVYYMLGFKFITSK